MSRISLLLALALALPLQASAQNRVANANGSTDTAPYVDSTGTPVQQVSGGEAVVLTHSATQNIVSLNSVSCNAGGLHTDNSYWRTFILPEFGVEGDLEVNSVDIGVEQAFGAGGSQPAELRFHTLDGPLATANLTPLGTINVTVADQELTILNIPVTGITAPAGSELVVEFFTPDGQTAGNGFFIGSNPDGETAPSYISAVDCGIPEPLTTGSIGFPGMHIVMNVNGDDLGTVANEDGAVARQVTLGEGYPNPSRAGATVPFTVSEPSDVRLAVYDVLGREVALLAEGTYAPGSYTARFDAAGLSSGVYVYRLEAEGTVQVQRVTLAR